MRIECIHGYFIFTESKAGRLSDFMSRFGLQIERSGDHFTFSDLVDAPDFSLAGGTFLGAPTTENYEGPAWEVMRANGLVYDFSAGLVVPIESILRTVRVQAAGNLYLSSGMILPGSIMEDGLRVTDYAAFYENLQFRYSEVVGE